MKQTIFLVIILFFTQAKAQVNDVELQWAICEPSAASLITKSEWTVKKSTAYSMTYLDSPSLEFLKDGVYARIVQDDKKSVSKLKLSFANEESIDWDWLAKKDFKCEYDQYSTRQSLRCTISNDQASPQNPWSKDQIDFLARTYPHLTLARLQKWGPLSGSKFKIQNKQIEITVDELLVPNEPPLIEVSVRVDRKDAGATAARMQAFLNKKSVRLCPKQIGKFERLIEFFNPL